MTRSLNTSSNTDKHADDVLNRREWPKVLEVKEEMAESNKYFYLHIPKTAGSSMNRFLTSQFDEGDCLTHIESKVSFQDNRDVKNAEEYTLLSGHVALPQMQHMLKVLDRRKTIATFRIPLEHVTSHIAWVRKLGDPGEEPRLKMHNEKIQDIAARLVNTDLSSANEVKSLVTWLENNDYYLFHDTQTRYLCDGPAGLFTPQLFNQALVHLSRIDFVGVVERLDEFIAMLCYRLGWHVHESDSLQENINPNTYGLDIHAPETRDALEPLIQWDQMIYRVARERFIDDMHDFLAEFEKSKWPRFSAVRGRYLLNQFRMGS